MKLSVVITTRNRYTDLKNCIDSIKNSDLQDVVWEMIIVDDNSSDETRNLDNIDGVKNSKVIHNDRNLMMVKSRNIGAQNARGQYILFIDDDNEIEEDMIKSLLVFAEGHKEYGIVGPSIYYFENKEKYLDYQRINLFTGKTSGLTDASKRKYCDTDGVPNVFMIKREVFEQVGYFDEELIQTYTEPDFSFNASGHGFMSCIVKSAKTFHKVSKSDSRTSRALGGMYKQKAYCLMRNRGILVKRYGTFFQRIIYFSIFSWAWPLVYSLLVLNEKRVDLIKLYWLGWIDSIKYAFTNKIYNSLPKDIS